MVAIVFPIIESTKTVKLTNIHSVGIISCGFFIFSKSYGIYYIIIGKKIYGRH